MRRLAVMRAQSPAVIRPRAVALGLRGATGAAALAESLMARYRLAGTWPADAELQVLTPPVPGAPRAPPRTERVRAAEPGTPLHIRLSADIRLIRRLLAERTSPPEPRRQPPGRAPVARTEVRVVETPRRSGPATPDRPARTERTATAARPDRPPALPGPAIIRIPGPASGTATSSVTVLRPIHIRAATETLGLLVIRAPAPAKPPTEAPVMAIRAPAPSRPKSPGREGPGPSNASHVPRTATPAAPVADAARPALPDRPANEAVPLEIVRRDAPSPAARDAETAGEPAARERPLAARTRVAAARLVARRAPKLAVRSRRGPRPSLDRRTLAGRPAPSTPRITPIIPRAVSQPGAAGEQATPTRVVARRIDREAAQAILEGASTLTPASPTPSPRAPGPRGRGDQRRQAVSLEVRRAPIPVAPPAPAAREVAERAAEPRGKAGPRPAEDRSKPVKLDAPTLRKALNELPVGDFEPLADRLIAEFEWQLKRGLERSGRL